MQPLERGLVKLLTRRASRGRRRWLVLREVDTRPCALLPERTEDGSIAMTTRCDGEAENE